MFVNYQELLEIAAAAMGNLPLDSFVLKRKDMAGLTLIKSNAQGYVDGLHKSNEKIFLLTSAPPAFVADTNSPAAAIDEATNEAADSLAAILEILRQHNSTMAANTEPYYKP